MDDSMGEGRESGGDGESFLPNLCSLPMVFLVVVSAELLAIILTLASIDSLQAFASTLSLNSLFIQWVALVGGGLICLLRRYLAGCRDWVVGVVCWTILLLVTLLAAGLTLVFYDSNDALRFLLASCGISAIVSALVLRYLYIQYLWRTQIEAESRARFQALQSRIRPHFLFNSMNTIAHLTRSNPLLAEEVVHDLSDLFRASLSDAGKMSTLGDELELARGYLRIEEQRLGERLRVEWDLEALPEQARLPALILQPLLENAVYHGIEPSTEPGVIQVSGRYRRGMVNIGIRNSVPREGQESHRKGNQMALENTRLRLLGCFGDAANITLGEVDGEHQVRVVFPYTGEGR